MAERSGNHGGMVAQGMSATHVTLTRNERTVLAALVGRRALTAYELLDRLREGGMTAPPTVYRALAGLVRKGLAHRLENLNAYVACPEPHADHHPVFVICEQCRSVSELDDLGAIATLEQAGRTAGFAVTRTTVELIGLCRACQSADRPAGAQPAGA